MDSGSGSLQSSSGGDEEYDSHQQQPQLFPPPPLFFNSNIPPPPPPLASHIISSSSSGSSSIPHHHHHQQLPFHLSHHNYQNLQVQPTSFYDFPSNFNLQPTNFNPDSSNSFLNLDVVRPNPTSLRSEPTDFKNPPAAEGSTQNQIPNRSTNPSSGVLHPKVNTKKRTRASRRAPTTVLTTDTTNFRAMVQEFTGIPSPPFTAGGSSSYSRRFDLFGSVRTNTTATNLEAPGSGSGLYPSRSKVQLFSSLNNNNVAVEDQNVSNLQQAQAQAGIFSFQSVSEGTHLEPLHIHGSSTSQQLLSALQNDETWRGNGGGTAATAAATRSNNNAAANCKLTFTGSSSSSNNLQRDKEILLGNIVSTTTTTTRGESTVDSWICPSD